MAMTLGKDVSALFPDVLKNIATSDLDQKKLVYLYLMYVWKSIIVRNSLVLEEFLMKSQELRKISPGSLYSRGQYVRSGFGRPQSPRTRFGNKDNGLHKGGENGGLYG